MGRTPQLKYLNTKLDERFNQVGVIVILLALGGRMPEALYSKLK